MRRTGEPEDSEAETLRSVERRRLKALVDADVQALDALHAPEFLLVHPTGGVWSKAHYLKGIRDGSINYHRFEPLSDMDVVLDGDLGIVRYRSAIDIGESASGDSSLTCWHLDCYVRDGRDSTWTVLWSQATAISQDST